MQYYANSLLTPVGDKKSFLSVELLIQLFDQTFLQSRNARLIGGFDEPEYRPAQGRQNHHLICFTHDYVSSALHEIAHWCIAGEARKKLTDYGYWYEPDGRSQEQQRLFEKVEVKPQALEWLFSRACGVKFRVSIDNLDGCVEASPEFSQAIVAQTRLYCKTGINPDAELWINVLSEQFGVDNVYEPSHFTLSCLL